MIVYPFAIHIPFCLGIPGLFCIREITGYGLMMMTGFLMAAWAIQLELRRRGLGDDYAADIVVGAVLGGLVGAKLWYVALAGSPDALFQRGGFVWYGGFLGGVAGVLLNGWRKGVPARFTCELCAAPLALGYALGRVGCFLVGDDYGIPSALPWAVKFPQGLPPSTVGELTQAGVQFPPDADPLTVVAVHPTQLYEVTVMFLAFGWLWGRRVHAYGTGWLFACYLVLAGLERFAVELVRAKDDRLLGDFTLAQATSVGLILAGAYLFRRWREPTPELGRPAALALSAQPSVVGGSHD